jgi:hypothetical protein
LTTHTQAQFLDVPEPLTLDNAKATLASLTQGRCNLVFAAGDKPVAAVREDAAKYAAVHFYLLGGGTDTSNLTHLPASTGTVSNTVADTITKTAGPACVAQDALAEGGVCSALLARACTTGPARDTAPQEPVRADGYGRRPGDREASP